MFGPHGGILDRLIAAGMPKEWVKALRNLLTNPLQSLEHHGPVTIKLSQGQPSKTAANRATAAPPADANKGPPALALFNLGSGRALHSQAGHIIIDGRTIDPDFSGNPGVPSLGIGDRMAVNIPSVYSHYVWFNYPVTMNDDIRMGVPPGKDSLIFKYAAPTYGSSIRRFKLKADMSGGKALAIPIDWNGIQAGLPFTVYDAGGATGAWACLKSGTIGFAIYFSDGTNLGLPDGYTAAANDNRVRPNLGNWQVLSADLTAADVDQHITIQIPTKICCVAGKMIICTQAFKTFLCPINATLGALDCGGTVICT